MSTSLSRIRDSYVQDIPRDIPIKAAQGFLATAAISLIFGCSATTAVSGGTIAIIATVVEAITRPIIRAVFPDHPFIAQSIQICVPYMLVLGLASSLVSYKVTAFPLSIIAWIVFNERFYERNVAMVQVL